MRRMRNGMAGYLTVYLTLCLMIMISLCLTLIEGARQNGMRLEIECVSTVANNSIFAEYNRELFHRYKMFAIDCSYGTSNADVYATGKRLLYYYEKNMEQNNKIKRNLFGFSPQSVSVDQYLLLTDKKGEMFRRQAVDIVKEDLGVGIVQQVMEWLNVVEEKQLTERNIHEEKQELEQQLTEYDGSEIEIIEQGQRIGFEVLQIINPTGKLEEIRKRSILLLILQPSERVSDKAIREKELVSERVLSGNALKGTLEMPDQSKLEQLTERIWFDEYLIRYMGHYGAVRESSALEYQLEYLVAGFDNDLDNLLAISEILLCLREVANTIYLFSDEEKYEEVKSLVSALTAVLMVPELTDILTPIVIMGWAFAESVYDVSSLVKGKRIPLIKDKSSWHLGLSGAMDGDFDKPSGETDREDIGQGLSYEDYFRILLCMVDRHIITERAMNMVEADLRLTPGNANFRMDGCIVGLMTTVSVSSTYGQAFLITRKKYY